MADSILKTKSFDFALRIIKASQFLRNEKGEYVLSKQLLRSGTAIGALVSEAAFGQSKADFTSKMSIALKEANETMYWLQLLEASNIIPENVVRSLISDCDQLVSMLVSSIKTAKNTK